MTKTPFTLEESRPQMPMRKTQEGGILDCLGIHQIPVNCLSYVWYREDTFFF
jgi:hypothetical protein